MTFCGCHIGVRLSELHFEHPREDLGFLGSSEALPQLRGLPIILLIQSKQVRGQVHHDWTIFLRIPPLQSLHAHRFFIFSVGGQGFPPRSRDIAF